MDRKRKHKSVGNVDDEDFHWKRKAREREKDRTIDEAFCTGVTDRQTDRQTDR
jgi:hypothetical protein